MAQACGDNNLLFSVYTQSKEIIYVLKHFSKYTRVGVTFKRTKLKFSKYPKTSYLVPATTLLFFGFFGNNKYQMQPRIKAKKI